MCPEVPYTPFMAGMDAAGIVMTATGSHLLATVVLVKRLCGSIGATQCDYCATHACACACAGCRRCAPTSAGTRGRPRLRLPLRPPGKLTTRSSLQT